MSHTSTQAGLTGSWVWDDIILVPSALTNAAIFPDLVTVPGTGVLLPGFDGVSKTESLTGSFEIPHGYQCGTDLRPHVHFMVAAGSGDVEWKLEYSRASVDGTLTTNQTVTALRTVTIGQHMVVEFDVIDGTDVDIGDVFLFRLYRVGNAANDTHNDDAILLSLGFHYKSDTVGSRGIFSKT